MNKPFSPRALNAIANGRDRQSAAIDAFNAAVQNQDHDTARAICDHVIGEEECNHIYAAGFQMHCLSWLTSYYHSRYSESADGSEEESAALDGFFHCLWVSKWIIARLPLDLDLSPEEIEKANEFMHELYYSVDFSRAAVAKALMHQSMYAGDAGAAATHFQKWQHLDKDSGGDCEACEHSSLIEYRHFTGDHAAVVELAEPVLSGSLSCGEVPHLTYAPVIDSLIRLNRRNEASELLARAVEHISGEGEAFHFLLAPLAALHNRLGEREAAAALFDEHGEDMVNAAQNNALYYLEYLMAVIPFNEEALAPARELAAKFDERNGNSHYQGKLEYLFQPAVLH